MTRKDGILKLIVEHFIKTAEPVGSKTLLEVYGLKVSSATIRNEMNALEQDGLLEKTHTSSGRVPSQSGYEYYVTHLRGDGVDDKVKYALSQVLDEKTKSVQEVIKESCEILSNMTNLVSVVLGSSGDSEKLVSIQAIPIGERTAAAVFVTDKGYVENKTFVIPEGMKAEEVANSVKLLNDRLAGTPITQLVGKMEKMRPILTDYVVGHDVIYKAMLEAFVRFTGERLSLYGKDALFNQPEFANSAEKLKMLLGLLDNPGSLRKAVSDGRGTDATGVTIHIGTKVEGLEDVSIVSAGLNLPGENGASLSVLGPTRMDYEKVVGTLEYFARALEDYFNTAGGTTCQKINKKEKTEKKSPPKAPKK